MASEPEPLGVDLVLLAKAVQERDRQPGDVALPVAERRQIDRHDVEPVIEVFAEIPFADHLAQFAVGGRNQADIDLAFGRVADLLHPLGLQHAEQLALGFHAQVGHFVEEQRARDGPPRTAPASWRSPR